MVDLDISTDTVPQRGVVTILVADVVGSTQASIDVEPEDMQDFLDGCFGHIRTIVETFGGKLIHFTGDGAIAIFGWPNPVEEHADLACRAALEVIKPVPAMRTPEGDTARLRVGIHSGLVIVRAIQTGVGGRLDAVGETVHLAAALQKAAAPGSILVSAQTRDLCRARLDATPPQHFQHDIPATLVPLELSTIAMPRIDPIGVLPPLFGRQEEIALIQSNLPMPGGTKNSIGLIGEPGIGKSRLMREAWQVASENDLNREIVFCDELTRSQPYHTVSRLLIKLLDADRSADADAFSNALNKIGVSKKDVGILQQVVQSHRLPSEAISQSQISRAFVDAINKAIDTTPTLISIEDIHRMDAESLAALGEWRSNSRSVPSLLLVSSRPEGQVQIEWLTEKQIPILPLPREFMHELALTFAERFGREEVDVDPLIDRADGVPFVLEQLSSHVYKDDESKFNPLPQSVESAIHARINRLSDEARHAVQTLSVIGNDNRIDFLCDVLELSGDAFDQTFQELETRGLVERVGSSTLRFRHDIILDACHSMLHRQQRKLLNQSILGKLDAYANVLANFHVRKADHAKKAGELEIALTSYWAASVAAVQASAKRSLDLIFDEAMKLISEMDKSAESKFVDFVLMAFDSMHQIGNIDKIRSFLPRAIELSREQGRQERECMALCHMSTAHWYAGTNDQGRPIARRAFEIAQKLDAMPLIFYTQFTLANVTYNLGDIDEAIYLQSRLAERLSGKLETARLGATLSPASISRSFLAYVLTDKGEHEWGLTTVDKAIEIAEREDQPYSIVMARMTKGRLLNALGRYEDAEEHFNIGFELVERHGMIAAHAALAGGLATSFARRNMPEKVMSIIEHVEASGAMDICTPFVNCAVMSAKYEASRCLSLEAQAQEAYNDALSLSKKLKDPITEAKVLSLPARVDHYHGFAMNRAHSDMLETAIRITRQFAFQLPHPHLQHIGNLEISPQGR